MKRTLLILSTMLAVGCVPPSDDKTPDGETTGQTTGCTMEECSNNNQNATLLKGALVSGHLGNYLDCPEEGYSKSASAPSDSMGADFAPCEMGDGSCGGPLNCDGAQLTIRLTNGGAAAIGSIEIDKIEMFSMDGELLAELPVTGAVEASTNAAFDGSLDAGESIDLRVDYRGPVRLSEFDESGASRADSAELEITVGAENGQSLIIESGELFVLPSVVT